MTSSTEQEAIDSSINESIGFRFQRERRNQHKTLEEVAEATCIHISTLKAIEADDHELLPAVVFVKGFIKIYAKYLGIDPAEALSHYNPPPQEEVVTDSNSSYYQEIITAEEQVDKEPIISVKKVFLIIIIFLLIIILYTASRIFVGDITELPINIQQPGTEQVAPTASQETDPVFTPTPGLAERNTDNLPVKKPATVKTIPPAEQEKPEEQAETPQATEEKETIPVPAPPEHISALPITNNNIIHTQAPPPAAEITVYSSATENAMEADYAQTSDSPQSPTPAPAKLLTAEKPTADIPADNQQIAHIPTPVSTPAEAKPQNIEMATQFTATAEVKNKTDDINQKAEQVFEQVLTAEFIEPTWLKVQIDNKKARQYTYQPGTIRTWQAHTRIKMHLGNAGGVILTLNGRQLAKPGKSGRTARITIPDDYL